MTKQQGRWLFQARRALFETYRQQMASVWIEARGSSMRPLIDPGAWMLVEFGALPVDLGEIILFSHDERLIAHRVVAQRQDQDTSCLIAKGDAEPYCDAPVRCADVLGVVRALRYGPGGYPTRVGCVGRFTRAIARISRWNGYGAALVRRGAVLLPAPLKRVVMRAIPPATRVAADVLLAPVRWIAWTQTTQLRIKNRDEPV